MKIVFATNNKNKLKEIREILGDRVEVLSLKDIGCDVDIPETGATLEENALQKAQYIYDHYHMNVFADDTGLEVEALNGAPGIYSARYMEGHPYSERNAALIERVKEAKGEERSARFVCNIAAVLPDGTAEHAEAVYEGLIAEQPAGENGFGYDPILYLPEYGKTSAELTEEEKNAISHRGKALRAMKEILKNRLEEFRL